MIGIIICNSDVSGYIFLIFFFQAEDGIRDYKVTGVQTCALPIWLGIHAPLVGSLASSFPFQPWSSSWPALPQSPSLRSEERRCRERV